MSYRTCRIAEINNNEIRSLWFLWIYHEELSSFKFPFPVVALVLRRIFCGTFTIAELVWWVKVKETEAFALLIIRSLNH